MKKAILITIAICSVSFATMAQSKSKATHEHAEMKMDNYACSMHPEVTSDKPGKCSKCGMNLVKQEASMEKYTCSMHPEVTSDKPGNCSKCGMTLVKAEKKEMKMKDGEMHSGHKH